MAGSTVNSQLVIRQDVPERNPVRMRRRWQVGRLELRGPRGGCGGKRDRAAND